MSLSRRLLLGSRKQSYSVAGLQEELTYSGWGEPVKIQAPTADQILTLG